MNNEELELFSELVHTCKKYLYSFELEFNEPEGLFYLRIKDEDGIDWNRSRETRLKKLDFKTIVIQALEEMNINGPRK